MDKQTNAGIKTVSTFQIPKDVFIYYCTKFPGEKTGGLIGITPEKIVAFPFSNGRFDKTSKIIATISTALFKGESRVPLMKKFIYPCDNSQESPSLIIIPDTEKIIVVKLDGVNTAGNNVSTLPVSQEITISSKSLVNIDKDLTSPVSSVLYLPFFYLNDVNGDQKNDLIIYADNYIFINTQDENGKFNRNSSHPPEGIDISLHRRRKNDQQREYEIIPVIKDVNNDGLSDMLASNGSEGISAVYLNRGTNIFFQSQKPDFLKRIDGWLISHDLTDVNNDGIPDLVLILMRKVGVTSGLKILLAHSVNWEMEVYLGRNTKDPSQIYTNVPDYNRTINVPFTLSLDPDALNLQTPFLLNFDDDLNKDKLNELIIKESDSNIVSIYNGNSGVFERGSTINLNLKAPIAFTSPRIPYGKPFINDLNHDGELDFIIHQQDFKGQHHFFEFFINK
ncbi:MAG: VCBS repeat-containing protein [Planctomycetes bacterium]|nr:VCBS repeat-containing protein [Planctomycetota bacterium]